ncbi:AraC family transcriptional regulator [Acidiphilium sp. AL]|uniref:AraC family transcriptional regulator n=1 Tax=Acidiphilium iwatense TaxID=768198 RepID=A0ABS9DT54_9PROT|nr:MULTISPECIES: AraC family transcriptional regulator [Acidiphilium]MCF3945921.1 AraC family transcriptional regulator [Acidiphilium iwatense]MCU4159198.1 AraC family transcriptional regulator [Acidiphilium sp. AL]
MTVSIRRYERLPGQHIHSFDQIVLPFAGTMDIEIGSRGGKVDAGHGALIAAGQRHVFHAEPGDRFIVVDMDDIAIVPERGAFFPIPSAIAHLLGYVRARQDNSAQHSDLHVPLPDMFARPWATLLVDALFGLETSPVDSGGRAIARAFKFMRANLEKRCTTAEIAAAAGLGERRLHALFHARFGSTPREELMRLRLDFARALLCSTSLPIAEIAVMSGHADQSALTRRMRDVRGITPAVARRIASA